MHLYLTLLWPHLFVGLFYDKNDQRFPSAWNMKNKLPSDNKLKDTQRMDAFLITLIAGGVVLWLFENNNGENK